MLQNSLKPVILKQTFDYCCRRIFSTSVDDFVKIVEVGPRDGLQNEKVMNTYLPTFTNFEITNVLLLAICIW